MLCYVLRVGSTEYIRGVELVMNFITKLLIIFTPQKIDDKKIYILKERNEYEMQICILISNFAEANLIKY